MQIKKDFILDMETSDPDDFLTLLLLLGHPKVNLKAVTITPGTEEQVGLVKWACKLFNKDLSIGSFCPTHDKKCVSDWHYNNFGKIPKAKATDLGCVILKEMCNEQTLLVTGAPLKNIGAAIDLGFVLNDIVIQGGFAGEGVVPQDKQLPKFKGRTTCPTYNLNGDSQSALKLLEYNGIKNRWFVSKNVCHGVVYDAELHDKLALVKDSSLSLSLIYKSITYRQNKKLHDPLAACCAIDRSIGTWKEVQLYKKENEWGSRLSNGTNTNIIIDYDKEKFVNTLLEFER